MADLKELLSQLPADITVGAFENVHFALMNDGDGQYVCEAISDKGPSYDSVFVDMGGTLGMQPLFFMRDTPEEAVGCMVNWLRTGNYMK